ncbi:MAG: hypothetical protein SP4CHLAM5_05330 [Chlamydiia bacterium]|nr:hypothetical protein [Chlamydiia bacterium]MCH9618403.1 hypothetical protein [Chlamydiia bacterium]MCH9624279.1 hypothetical protein [Chlamydiia bacterium]
MWENIDFGMIYAMHIIFFLLLFLLSSCSTADQRVELRRMNNNKSSEKIYRLSHEQVYKEKAMQLSARELYPWENETEFAKITMNTLRCRGDISHPKRAKDKREYEDCGGMHHHGLPYVDGEEFVYPVLISLLNKVQNSFNKKVVVTSGHRCPKHNNYLTLGTSKISKYMIGAKVDFYVEGLEDSYEDVIDRIMYLYEGDKEEYSLFKKITGKGSFASWRNKEITITVQKDGEHTVLLNKNHPVISIEVRYDRERKAPVVLDWKKAYQGFIVN